MKIIVDYDPYLTPEAHGYICAEDVPDLEKVRDFFQGVLEATYTTGDTQSLHHCLEELSALINVDLPDGELKIKA